MSNPPTPAVNANPYAYGNDDPLDATDTSGHDACTSDDIKAQEEAYEAQQAWLKQWQAGAWDRMEKYSQDQHKAWEREHAREVARNEADERALQQQIADQERQFENEFNDAMNWQPSGHSGGRGSGSDSVSYGNSYGSYGSHGSSGSNYSSLYYGVAAGGALTYGYGAASSASGGAAAEGLEAVGDVIWEELASASAEELLFGLALAASADDDCGAHGIPTRPKNQNLGGVNTTPVIGTTPDEDPAAAAAHDATSSSAAADTGVATADSGGLGGGAGSGRRDDRCDTGAGFNSKGNIVYLPRHLQAGECVATGAFASLDKSDYTPPPRPNLRFGLPGLTTLPSDNRARGHLIGYAFGGSNKDTRNFVPMYQVANQDMFDYAEAPVLKAIQGGGHEFIEVTPVYGDPSSPIPTEVHFVAFGTTDLECVIENTPTGGAHCT